MPTKAELEAAEAVINEIQAIRKQIYEETKDMTSEERVEYIRREVAPVIAQYGI